MALAVTSHNASWPRFCTIYVLTSLTWHCWPFVLVAQSASAGLDLSCGIRCNFLWDGFGNWVSGKRGTPRWKPFIAADGKLTKRCYKRCCLITLLRERITSQIVVTTDIPLWTLIFIAVWYIKLCEIKKRWANFIVLISIWREFAQTPLQIPTYVQNNSVWKE